MVLHQLGEVEKAREYYEQLVKQTGATATEAQKALQAEVAELLGVEQEADP